MQVYINLVNCSIIVLERDFYKYTYLPTLPCHKFSSQDFVKTYNADGMVLYITGVCQTNTLHLKYLIPYQYNWSCLYILYIPKIISCLFDLFVYCLFVYCLFLYCLILGFFTPTCRPDSS